MGCLRDTSRTMILGASSIASAGRFERLVPGLLPSERLREHLAGVGFVLLFPGYLIYHYGISAAWWGPVLGGMFAAVTVLVATFAVVASVLPGAAQERLNSLHAVFLVGLAHMLAWSVGHLPFVSRGEVASQITTEALATVIIWVAVIFVGAHFPCRQKSIARISFFGLALIVLCFAHAFYDRGFPLGPFLAFVSPEDGEYSTYQGIGRSLVAVGVVAAIAREPYTVRAMIILIGTALLLLTLGSRAHFFVLCLVLVLQMILLIGYRGTRWLGVFGLVVTAVIATASVNLFLETRAAEILDLASSASWDERSKANVRALAIISERPWLGAFGYHVWDEAGYAHNVLSAWTQYGLIGFVLFLTTMLVASVISAVGYLNRRGSDAAWLLALHVNFISIVLAVASEPIMASVFPPLAWGFTLRAMRLSRMTNQLARA